MTMLDQRRWMSWVLEASAGPTPPLPFARGERPSRRARPRAIPVAAFATARALAGARATAAASTAPATSPLAV